MKKWLLGTPKKALKNSYIWNFIASGINASEAVVIMMISVRVVGVCRTGLLSIAFTVANLMMCIGKFGVRNFQVTDTKKDYLFCEYHSARVISFCFMLLGLFSYVLCSTVFASNPSKEKNCILIVVTLIYGVEVYEDVFLSELQRKGRLDIGAKMFSFRWVITLLSWGICLIISHNIIISTCFAFMMDISCFFYLLSLIRNEIDSFSFSIYSSASIKIIHSCLPICISTFLGIYLPNAAKYAIDFNLTSEHQAYYGFLSMPIFIINILSSIIFQPLLNDIARIWNNGDFILFIQRTKKIYFYILAISLLVFIIGFFLGIPVLSFLYATDLSSYKTEFMILLLGASALGFISFLNTILIIQRKQKRLMNIYIIISIICFIVLSISVKNFGLFGCIIANVLMLFILNCCLYRYANYNISRQIMTVEHGERD